MLCSRSPAEVLLYYQYRDEIFIEKLEEGEKIK